MIPTQRQPALSRRELQTLVGMARGMTNAQIGRELTLSEHTVKCHARRLFKTLGATHRAHAVAIGYETGLLRHGDVPTAHPVPRPGVRDLITVLTAIRDGYAAATGRPADPTHTRST